MGFGRMLSTPATLRPGNDRHDWYKRMLSFLSMFGMILTILVPVYLLIDIYIYIYILNIRETGK